MIFPLPKKPDGSTPEAIYQKRIWEAVAFLMQQNAVAGQKTNQTTRGSFTVFEPQKKAAAVTSNGPLTDAVWDSSRSVIYGARGGLIYEYDSSGEPTGRSLAFAPTFFGDSYLLLDGDTLWATNWCDPNGPEDIPTWDSVPNVKKGFYLIDTASLTVDTYIPFNNPQNGTAGANIGTTIPSTPTLTTGMRANDLTAAPHEIYGFQNVTVVDLPNSDPGIFFYPASPISGPDFSNVHSLEPKTLVIGPFANDVTITTSFPEGPNDQKYFFDGVENNTHSLSAGATVTITFKTRIRVWGNVGSEYYTYGLYPGESFLRIHGLPESVGWIQDPTWHFQNGPRKLLKDNDGNFWVTSLAGTSSYPESLWSVFDPEDLLFINHGGTPEWGELETMGERSCSAYAIAHDPATNRIWAMESDGSYLGSWELDGSNWLSEIDSASLWSYGAKQVYGIEIAGDYVYLVTKTNLVEKVAKGSPYTHTTIDLNRANAKPRTIKYVAFKSRLYVPTMEDNAVVEINPATGEVTNTYTDFDLPYSIVATDAAVFAVQLGNEGLKKVC